MILVLSSPRDEHALRTLVELGKLGAHAQLLDISEFPQRLGLSMSYRDKNRRFLLGCEGNGLDLDECDVVWWRRPQSPVISGDVSRPSERQFAFNEAIEALYGLWQSLDAFWINEPARDLIAQRKAYQLRIAQEVGLEIPETIITNCPRSALDFISRLGLGHVIYKAFSATLEEWRETRLLREEEMRLIDNVRVTPVIFQEYIEANVDLRITIVGEEIFPVAIYSQQTSYKVDFRLDIANARIEATQLPESVASSLLALMHRLGLVYGAIDMRRTTDGRYVFLEINPAGQWLFTEEPSGLPITASLAKLIRAHDR